MDASCTVNERLSLGTLPPELLSMILGDYTLPDLVQLFELRTLCRAVGAAASQAFLAKVRRLLVTRADRSPAFAVAVEAIRRRGGTGEPSIAPFSLGCLLRAVGLPTDSFSVAPILERLCASSEDRSLEVAAALRGLGSSVEQSVDCIWSLYRMRATPLWTMAEVDTVLFIAFPTPADSARMEAALMNSAFEDDDKFALIAHRRSHMSYVRMDASAKFEMVYAEVFRRYPFSDEAVVDMLAASAFLWREPAKLIGRAVADSDLTWAQRRRLIGVWPPHLMPQFLLGVLTDPRVDEFGECEEEWREISAMFNSMAPDKSVHLVAAYFAELDSRFLCLSVLERFAVSTK